jgi:hypothetical protein
MEKPVGLAHWLSQKEEDDETDHQSPAAHRGDRDRRGQDHYQNTAGGGLVP